MRIENDIKWREGTNENPQIKNNIPLCKQSITAMIIESVCFLCDIYLRGQTYWFIYQRCHVQIAICVGAQSNENHQHHQQQQQQNHQASQCKQVKAFQFSKSGADLKKK